ERIKKKIGDIVLRAGDTLLLEAHPSFAEQQRNSRDFYLVSAVPDSAPVRHEKALIAAGIMLAMVIVVSIRWLSMLTASMLAACTVVTFKCCTPRMARRQVDWQILVAVAASFAYGTALETTGVARLAADRVIGMVHGDPWLMLVATSLIAMVLASIVTHSAA